MVSGYSTSDREQARSYTNQTRTKKAHLAAQVWDIYLEVGGWVANR